MIADLGELAPEEIGPKVLREHAAGFVRKVLKEGMARFGRVSNGSIGVNARKEGNTYKWSGFEGS